MIFVRKMKTTTKTRWRTTETSTTRSTHRPACFVFMRRCFRSITELAPERFCGFDEESSFEKLSKGVSEKMMAEFAMRGVKGQMINQPSLLSSRSAQALERRSSGCCASAMTWLVLGCISTNRTDEMVFSKYLPTRYRPSADLRTQNFHR